MCRESEVRFAIDLHVEGWGFQEFCGHCETRSPSSDTAHPAPYSPHSSLFFPKTQIPGLGSMGPSIAGVCLCIASLPKCKHDMTRWTIATLVLEHTRPLPRGVLGLFPIVQVLDKGGGSITSLQRKVKAHQPHQLPAKVSS